MVALPIVLLIFFSSNQPQVKDLNEGLVSPTTTPQPEKGFVDNGKSSTVSRSQVNDLTAADIKFPDDSLKGKIVTHTKIIREKLVPNGKAEDENIPVPLYSLVKNDCGEGYALDENGICQKTINVRSGKKFDSEKRRKRHVLDRDRASRRKRSNENAVESDFRRVQADCTQLYPGMVSDGNGGCKKPIKSLVHTLDKTLPS